MSVGSFPPNQNHVVLDTLHRGMIKLIQNNNISYSDAFRQELWVFLRDRLTSHVVTKHKLRSAALTNAVKPKRKPRTQVTRELVDKVTLAYNSAKSHRTQQDLAEEFGVSDTTISRILNREYEGKSLPRF